MIKIFVIFRLDIMLQKKNGFDHEYSCGKFCKTSHERVKK